MIYKKAEELIEQGSEGLQKVLEELRVEFGMLEDFSDQLKDSDLTGDDLSDIMTRSAGIWNNLNIVHSVIDSYKSKKEGDFFQTKKIELESKNEKINVSALEKESSANVNPERRVRNIINAYLSVADRNIGMIQSRLKFIVESGKRNALQDG
jgi:hypothetical protein